MSRLSPPLRTLSSVMNKRAFVSYSIDTKYNLNKITNLFQRDHPHRKFGSYFEVEWMNEVVAASKLISKTLVQLPEHFITHLASSKVIIKTEMYPSVGMFS